eukprot:gene48419-59295_t
MIRTHAGYSSAQYDDRGNGQSALFARFQRPRGIYASAATGDIFIIEESYIRKIQGGTSVVSDYAGGGSSYEDNVTATAAVIGAGWGISGDSNGDVYYSDAVSCVVRKVERISGLVFTVAGQMSACGYLGDFGDGTNALLSEPLGISVFQTDLFIADSLNCRIRVLNLTNGVIKTFVGNGVCATSEPGSGAGIATTTSISAPSNVWVNMYGHVFFTDTTYCAVRSVINTDMYIAAGTGTCGNASSWSANAASVTIQGPEALCGDGESIYFFLNDQSGLYGSSPSGELARVAGGYSSYQRGDGV